MGEIERQIAALEKRLAALADPEYRARYMWYRRALSLSQIPEREREEAAHAYASGNPSVKVRFAVFRAYEAHADELGPPPPLHPDLAEAIRKRMAETNRRRVESGEPPITLAELNRRRAERGEPPLDASHWRTKR